ncbi:signal peptidase II [Undibacterium oligocarboniphilum]|uniref:Lipoprotein signal peptidase n=1 Tax=Undibacterium oligocarboniphilum TaxID=666702 RepID=A0A850QJ75_9BURK|nr:signal peptidase II [Undibacterium oligocarboniphilum]MBC3871830.1 lipoprotein signal peptidase [Undibacterium oligocarboniphilum]NVO79318.1 lipoprotein signal peptidase [Undibacterium oligocarboniphilum]
MASKKSPKSVSRPHSSGNSLIPWLGLATIVILLDQVSKITITKLFAYGETLAVTGFFNLMLVYNKGAAFSFLAAESGWQRYLFTAIGLIAAAYITFLLKRHSSQKLFCWALSLIMGGALGNVIDRLLYGHVIDFLDFHYQELYHFPAFNIADSAITIGAALFILDELRRVRK